MDLETWVSKSEILKLLISLLILVVWYVSSSACNIGSKLFIPKSKPIMPFDCTVTILSLSMLQLVWGMFFGALASGRISSIMDLCRIDKLVSDHHYGYVWISPTKSSQVFSAICHAIGGFSLNLCYLYFFVFIVQVLKCAEPVATLSLGVVILNEV